MMRTLAVVFALSLLAAPAAAQQQQQQQQNVERSTNGDWTVECVTDPNSGRRLCRMLQNVPDPKTGKPLMQVVVAKPPGANGQALLTVIAPLGVWLRPGMSYNVDGGAANKLNFEFCLKEGCLARSPLSAGLVNAFKRGSSVRMSLQDIRQRKLDLSVSLRGFTASFGAI